MCGIFGIHGNYFNDDNYLHDVKSFLENRGPDNYGILKLKSVETSFVHTRLSILELSKYGDQPMYSDTKNSILVFNGEIYNHFELRKDINLKKKINWKGTSDSETLINFIELFGVEKFLDNASGMFAFCFYDIKTNNLILARDRFGEKPLYYTFENNNFIFSSTLKPLLKSPINNFNINKKSLYNYFNFGFVPGSNSIISNIKKIQPGSFLKYNLKSKEIKNYKYWDIIKEFKEKRKNFSFNPTNSIDYFEKIISNSVKEQMISDVPIGSFLSGGIDSSLTSILMNKYSSSKIKTFNVSFENKNYDESEYANFLASKINSNHTSLVMNDSHLKNFIPDIGNFYDEPFADSSQIPTLFVSHLASQSVKVCLTGDGADELFGGYNRYFFAKKICNNPLFFRNFLSKTIEKIGPYNIQKLYNIFDYFLPKNFKINMIGDKLLKLSNILNSSNNYEVYIKLFKNSNLEDIYLEKNYEFDNSIFNLFTELDNFTFEEKMMTVDIIYYLSDDILTKVDRGSMAFSLETRAPFLNKNVVNYAFSIPIEQKIKNQNGKIVLKKLIEKYIPDFDFKRPKTGFGIPLNEWLSGPLKEWALDNLTRNNIIETGMFNYNIFNQKINEHYAGKRNWQNLIWNFLMFQSWKEKFK